MYDKKFTSQHNEKLYVVTAISNPARYHSRYYLYDKFAKHLADSGAQLLTIEAVLGRRLHTVTEPDNPWHIQLQTEHELWHKENMLNIAISRLPADWRYVAWLDADIEFVRKNWVDETLHQLQHFDI